jgi:hypothetical protein
VVNHAHLCVSNHESIYPTFADEAYDPAVHTVATCPRSVPLLWFGLFRPKDLVTRVFETDDGPYVVVAPIATREIAVKQLSLAVPRFDQLFALPAGFETLAQSLSTAIMAAPGQRVTVEWDEIAVITDGDFLGEATAAMASLEEEGDDLVDRARLLRLSGLTRMFPARRKSVPDSFLPLDRLIGLGRSLPEIKPAGQRSSSS